MTATVQDLTPEDVRQISPNAIMADQWPDHVSSWWLVFRHPRALVAGPMARLRRRATPFSNPTATLKGAKGP